MRFFVSQLSTPDLFFPPITTRLSDVLPWGFRTDYRLYYTLLPSPTADLLHPATALVPRQLQ